MWVMTNFGIFMPSVRPANTIPKGDLRTLQIRARREKDLAELRNRHMPDTLGPTIYMPNTDYQFRAYTTPDDWAHAMASMAYSIDYTKFKPTAIDNDLHDALMAVWNTLFARWGGWGQFGSRFDRLRPKSKPVRQDEDRYAQWWLDRLPASTPAQPKVTTQPPAPAFVPPAPVAPVVRSVEDGLELTVAQWQLLYGSLSDAKYARTKGSLNADTSDIDELEETLGLWLEQLEDMDMDAPDEEPEVIEVNPEAGDDDFDPFEDDADAQAFYVSRRQRRRNRRRR